MFFLHHYLQYYQCYITNPNWYHERDIFSATSQFGPFHSSSMPTDGVPTLRRVTLHSTAPWVRMSIIFGNSISTSIKALAQWIAVSRIVQNEQHTAPACKSPAWSITPSCRMWLPTPADQLHWAVVYGSQLQLINYTEL